MTRFFAARTTQEAVGCSVAPRTRIRRLLCSMTANTYRRAPLKVKASGGYVSLRASAVDMVGNAVTETIIRAYALR